ncbi:MAG: hypothetical protein FD155_446 [Bacteroidetes bacterium]|nr:MAG: hypothetical protein FD155_446 [Bacteroidota bacterium]
MDNETTGGSISIEMLVETGMLDKALKQSIDKIKQTGNEASQIGKRVDEAFAGSTRAVFEQKEAVERLKNTYKELKDRAASLAPGKAQYEIIKLAKEAKRELEAEIEVMNKMQQAVKQNDNALESFRTQLRKVTEEIARMYDAGQGDTDAYRALQEEAGRLKNSISDARRAAAVLADDQVAFKGIISGLSGIAGGFAAAQGAMGLYAGENENLQKIMLRVQSLMAITIGLQQVQQTLNKDEPFILHTVSKAKQIYAATIDTLTTAFRGSTIAANMFLGTVTLGASVLIGVAIKHIDKYITKQKELAKKQEEFAAKVADEAYKAISVIETLSAKYSLLGDDLKAKEKFVRDNAEAFDDLGISIRNVNDAESVLNNNKKAFINAQIEKAKSLAALSLASEKTREMVLIDQKLMNTPNQKTQRITDPETGILLSSVTIENPDYTELVDKQEVLKKEFRELTDLAIKSEESASETLKKLGLAGDETLGIIEKLGKELSELNGKRDKSKSGSEILALNKEIEAKKNELSKYEVKESKSSKKDPFSDQLEKRKKLYQDYFNWINANRPDLAESAKTEFEDLLKGGNSFIESLEKQAKELEGKKGITDEQKKQLKTIRDYIATEVKTTALDTFEKELTAKLEAAKTTLEKMSILDQAKPSGKTDLDTAKQDIIDSEKEKTIRDEKELTKQLLANYAGYLQEKIDFNETYAEKKRLLNIASEKAENEDAKKIAKEALDELERQKDQYNKKSGNKNYDDLVERYKSFKHQLNDLVTDFDKNIKIALNNGNKELADTILKAKEEESKKLITSFSGNEVSQYLESLNKSLAVNLAIFSVTGEQSEELLKIKSIIELINKALKEGGEREDFVKALGFAINSLQQVSGMMGDVDEKSRVIVDRLINVADGLSQIYSGNVFQGATQIFFSIADALDKQFGMQKQIAKVEEARAEYNRQLSLNLETITTELDKQLKVLDEVSIGAGFDGSIAALRNSIQEVSQDFENLKFDLDKGPKNVRVQFDIDYLKAVYKTQDAAKALKEAFAVGLISQEQYDLAMQYLASIEDAQERIKQLNEQLKNEIIGGLADSLADELIEGFMEGKRAAADFAGTLEDLIIKALVNAFVVKTLMPRLDWLMDIFYGMSNDADGFTEQDAIDFQSLAGALIEQSGKDYEFLNQFVQGITGKPLGSSLDANSLSGQVKGVTEQTAGLLVGQINAMRINQAHALALMDEQLMHLSEIAANTRFNSRLQKLDLLVDIKNILQGGKSSASNTIRANGGE